MFEIQNIDNNLHIHAYKCGHNFRDICIVNDFFLENVQNHIVTFPKPLGISLIKNLIEKIDRLIILNLKSKDAIEGTLREIKP